MDTCCSVCLRIRLAEYHTFFDVTVDFQEIHTSSPLVRCISFSLLLSVGSGARVFVAECDPFCALQGVIYVVATSEIDICLHPGGGASQLWKLRSGLFPNRRHPGWTVEDVRRPSLTKATTLVVQLESCEAGVARGGSQPHRRS